MLKRLHVRNFTVFADAEFKFSSGLNVIVGTNGTGKSHVLKLGYTIEAVGAELLNDEWLVQDTHNWQNGLARRLMRGFRPESLGRLVRAQAKSGHTPNPNAYITAEYLSDQAATVEFNFAADAQIFPDYTRQPITVSKFVQGVELLMPVFMPAKEVLAMFTGLVSLARERAISIDQTYVDLAEHLEAPARNHPKDYAQKAISLLERAMNGKIGLDNGRFYLYPSDGERQAIDMAAEGFRKLATLVQLLSNGRLSPKNTLYWDEPEANLNPALLKEIAALLVALAQAGVQVILATHSLFLLKELHILSRREKLNQLTYFGLFQSKEGDTRVETTNYFELLQHITSLDAELTQTFDYEETLDQQGADDANDTRG